MLDPDHPVEKLPGLSAPDRRGLAALGLTTLYDALLWLPFRYDDWTRLAPIAELQAGDDVTLRVTVDRLRRSTTRRRRVPVIEVTFRDESGRLDVTFFNTKIDRLLKPGMEVILQGRADFHGRLSIGNPQVEPIRPGEPVPAFHPIYRATEGMPPWRLTRALPALAREYADAISDPVPADVLADRHMPALAEALRTVHAPEVETTWADLQRARERVVYSELFLLEGALAIRRERLAPPDLPPAFEVPDAVHERILTRLPFTPTASQERAFADIRRDFTSPGRMQRLIQGDVGTGKTAVAVYAMLATVAARQQVAMLAPTEILARQHAGRLEQMLADSRVRVGLLVGGLPMAERGRLLARLAGGRIDIVVGTHALLEPDVQFAALATVVIDEQHRFGVQQRQALTEKGATPHVLVMTATPIPRTLALTACGDLDLTLLTERPADRPPVTTRYVAPTREDGAWRLLRDRLAEGEQAYVVCPLVQDAGRDSASVEATARRLLQRDRLGPTERLAVLHGSMSTDQKARAMQEFAEGQSRVMVASTVVEVGVDVAAATLMLVLSAEQLGLVQLHQLRGRVGRGDKPGICLLLGDPQTDEARARIRLLVESDDGFRIAEADLQARGAGEWFGTKQHGLPRLRVADLLRDASVVEAARDDARKAVADRMVSRQALEAALIRHFGPDVPIVSEAGG